MMKRVGFSGVAISVLLSACQNIAPPQAHAHATETQATSEPSPALVHTSVVSART